MLLQEFELDKQESARASNRDGLQNTFSSDRIICGISWQRRPKLRPTSTEQFGDWVKKSWDQRPSKSAGLCAKETFKWSYSPSSVWGLISRGWRGTGGRGIQYETPLCPHFPFIWTMWRCFARQTVPLRWTLGSKSSLHRKNCKCCPGHYLIVNHYHPMSWSKFRNCQ